MSELDEILEAFIMSHHISRGVVFGDGSKIPRLTQEESKAAIKVLILGLLGEDEDLITPENYDKFNKNNTSIFYENRAIDTRNKLKAKLRQEVEAL